MNSSSELRLDARLGYKNKEEEDWKELASSEEVRQLKCNAVRSRYLFVNCQQNLFRSTVVCSHVANSGLYKLVLLFVKEIY